MTTSQGPVHKSKSFQDCRETEIPGYNDCPSFLFNVSKKTGRKHRLQTSVQDTYGSTKLPIAPPPLATKRSSNSANKEVKLDGNKEETSTASSLQELSETDILKRVNELIERCSKLSDKEYEYYKRKVDLNLPKSITNQSTKISMLQFLEITDNKVEQAIFLRKWMIMDITISNWCPAFVKLVENVKD